MQDLSGKVKTESRSSFHNSLYRDSNCYDIPEGVPKSGKFGAFQKGVNYLLLLFFDRCGNSYSLREFHPLISKLDQ